MVIQPTLNIMFQNKKSLFIWCYNVFVMLYGDNIYLPIVEKYLDNKNFVNRYELCPIDNP